MYRFKILRTDTLSSRTKTKGLDFQYLQSPQTTSDATAQKQVQWGSFQAQILRLLYLQCPQTTLDATAQNVYNKECPLTTKL